MHSTSSASHSYDVRHAILSGNRVGFEGTISEVIMRSMTELGTSKTPAAQTNESDSAERTSYISAKTQPQILTILLLDTCMLFQQIKSLLSKPEICVVSSLSRKLVGK